MILPVLATLLLAVVRAGLVVRDQTLVTHAAREAVRAAAVDPDPTPGAGNQTHIWEPLHSVACARLTHPRWVSPPG